MTVRCVLVVLLAAALAACNGGGASGSLPQACELLPQDFMEEVLTEPVRKPTPTAANYGELSACTFSLPARSLDDYLGIYLMPAATAKDALQLQAVAAEWKTRNAEADYEVLPNADYPMAWFPGQRKVYPSTFIILFEEVTLVITGIDLNDAKAFAFKAMQEHGWH